MPKRVSNEVHMKQKLRYNARSRAFAVKAHGSWSIIDELRVMSHDIPDSQLGKEIGRSIQAIQIKRIRLLNGDGNGWKYETPEELIGGHETWIGQAWQAALSFLHRYFILIKPRGLK